MRCQAQYFRTKKYLGIFFTLQVCPQLLAAFLVYSNIECVGPAAAAGPSLFPPSLRSYTRVDTNRTNKSWKSC